MKSLIIVPLVALSALSPVDAAPSIKSFPTSDCTGDPSSTTARPTVDECQNEVSSSEKELAIEGGTVFRYENRMNSAGDARGNCDGAANSTGYAVCGKCEGGASSRRTITCNVAAGTVVSQQVCNDDCSVCASANQTTYPLGECIGGQSTLTSLATGSVWSTSKYSAPGCAAANLTETDNRVCNTCVATGSAGDAIRSVLWDCETAGPISAGASTQFAAGLFFAFLMLLLTAF